LAWLLAAPAAGQLAVREQGPARWVSGGITGDERGELILLLPDYNLRVVTAAAGSGAYLSDATLVIRDAQGTALVETRLDGPWFLGRLPPGRYDVALGFGGATQKRTLTVPPAGRREAYFYWTGVPVDE
jgi:hypothetical protein